MRPLDEAWQYGEEPGGFGTLPLQHLRVQKPTQDGRVKITKIFGISNPADLGIKHLDGASIRRALERCHWYIREGRTGIPLRAEMREITRSFPEIFTVDNACDVDTQSETEMESEQY